MKQIMPIIFFAVLSITVPDSEVDIVQTDVISAQQWLLNAWKGKVARSRERIIRREVDKSLSEGTAIPDTEEGIIDKYLERPDYQTREEKEATRTR